MEVLASMAARTLLPLARAASNKVRQLYGEREGARAPLAVRTDLLDERLSESYGRLRGGTIEDAWWRRVFDAMAQEFVAPDFFRKPAVQGWLELPGVQKGFVAIASANVMDRAAHDESAIRERLAESYSEQTGEATNFAEGPIDVVVGCLTAGFFASIPPDQRSLAGMVQALKGELGGIRASLDRTLTQDPLVREALGKTAEGDLSEILALRKFDFQAAVDRMQLLWRRVDSGDLVAVPARARNEVCYWAARLHAANSATVAEARRMRELISEWYAESSLRTLDALILAAEGDSEGALRLLRDKDDPEARSAMLGILMRSDEPEAAISFCREVRPSVMPTHFTDLGWGAWAESMARAGRWEEAVEGLASLATKSAWSPALAITEGKVNAALLLPIERRTLALERIPIYPWIAPSVDARARKRHARAIECFEYVEKNLPANSDRVASELADWQTWLAVMDPDTRAAAIARQSVRKRLEDGRSGVSLVSLAWAFRIEFDDRALRVYIRKREQMGGLGDDDLIAECLLNQRTMNASDFSAYVEGGLDRLDRVLHKSFTTTMLFQAFLDDQQVERARTLMDKRREHLDEDMLARMDTALDAVEGDDPRERLETLHRESGDLADLRNLIAYLKSVRDREALAPLVEDLFVCEQTLDNAYEVVACLSQPPADHRSVVAFLEAYPTITKQSDDMKSALAWGLFHLGRVSESRKINDGLLNERQEQNDLALDVNLTVATGDWERLAAIVDREWPHRANLDPELLTTLARLASAPSALKIRVRRRCSRGVECHGRTPLGGAGGGFP